MGGVPPLRRPVVVSLAALLLGLLAPMPAARAADGGSVGIRLTEAPTSRADDPRARQYIVDHLAPGTKVQRHFEVSNATSSPQDIQLYAAAAALQDGAFVFGDGRSANELTGWTTVSPPTLHLAPGANGGGVVTIAVPAGAGGGERYGVVWAELPGATDASGITLVNRVGIRMYLSVGAEAEPPTAFRLSSFSPSLAPDGRPGIAIAACNDGGRAVDLEGDVALTGGPGGTSAGPFNSEGATTLGPAQCGTVAIKLTAGLPRGPWKARVRLHSGAVVRESEALLSFPANVGVAPPVKATAVVTGTGWGRLLASVAALGLLLAALASFLVWRRSRRAGQATA
ncbi:MAG: hypothetical protein QOF60_1240 [Actinomycetota bacterium]|jgi:hypothetical protein|nr:hypothetical protein [Actinomycetota bacterium]